MYMTINHFDLFVVFHLALLTFHIHNTTSHKKKNAFSFYVFVSMSLLNSTGGSQSDRGRGEPDGEDPP